MTVLLLLPQSLHPIADADPSWGGYAPQWLVVAIGLVLVISIVIELARGDR